MFQLHGDLIASDQALSEAATNLQDIQREAWLHLQTLFNQSMCLVNYLRSAAL